MILNARHLEILLACWQYGLLTAGDFQRLLHVRSRSHVRKLLGELCGGEDFAERQYLFRVPLPHANPGGTEKVYFLGSRGRSYLCKEGLPVEGYWRPRNARQVSLGHLMHNLTLARFLLAIQMFCADRKDIRLSEIRTQYHLLRDPLLRAASSEPAAGEAEPRVVPDAWADVWLVQEGRKPRRWPLLIEIDRGSQFSQAFKARLLARLSFIRPTGPYQRVFGTEFVTVVYLTTAGVARRDTMVRWAREVLAAEEREDWAELLLFGEVAFETMYEEAGRLLTMPVWERPADGAPVRLFG